MGAVALEMPHHRGRQVSQRASPPSQLEEAGSPVEAVEGSCTLAVEGWRRCTTSSSRWQQ